MTSLAWRLDGVDHLRPRRGFHITLCDACGSLALLRVFCLGALRWAALRHFGQMTLFALMRPADTQHDLVP